MYLVGIPLLVVPFAVYNMVEFLTPSGSPGLFWTHQVMSVHMLSDAVLTITGGDLLIALSILLLFVEFLKATRLSSRTIMDHMLSTLLFIGMLVEFLMVRHAATASFFLLLVTSFVDVVGGFSVTIRTAQRDISIERAETMHNS